MVETVEQAFLQRDCDQRARDGLGDGVGDMWNLTRIGRVIGVGRAISKLSKLRALP
jgi:hypothetical protein